MSFNHDGSHNISRQIHRQKPLHAVKLIDLIDAEGGAAERVTGRVQIIVPDPRLWVKLAFLFVPTVPGTAPDGAPKLWVAGREELRKPAPAAAIRVPVIDIVGASAAPLAIPVNSALFGYPVEIQTDVDELYAELSVQNYTVTGSWWAQATATQVTDMDRAEWEHIATAFNVAGSSAVVA